MSDTADNGAEAAQISVVIRPTTRGNEDKFSVSVPADVTVAQLKDKVAEHSSIAAGEQRLIYKGKILKDTQTLTEYGAGLQLQDAWLTVA